MSSSSSSDSDAMVVDASTSKAAAKSKTKTASRRASKADGKAKSRATVDTSDDESSSEEEGVAYKPPTGFKPLSIEVDAEFDWDAVSADPNAELWLIRVPEGFKTKQLDGLALRNGRGTISRKSGTATHLVAPADEQADEQAALRCLLPRKRKGGKLFAAPKPVSRHLVVTQVPATPTVDLTARPDEPRARTKRPEWPAAMLKGRFEPCGAKGVQAAAMVDSTAAVAASDDEMDEDERPAKKKSKVDSDSPAKDVGESAKKKQKHKKDSADVDETAEDKEKKRKEKEEKRERKRKAAEAAETLGSAKKSKKVKIA